MTNVATKPDRQSLSLSAHILIAVIDGTIWRYGIHIRVVRIRVGSKRERRMSEERRIRAKGATAIAAVRQKSILSLIERGDVIAAVDLAERIGVSAETIRRDMRALEQQGLLRRVHGGAMPTASFDLAVRQPIPERMEVNRDAKIAAASAALSLFADDMNVFLGASSTMLYLAEALAASGKSLTVTTNMIDIATVLAPSSRFTVTLLGGIVNSQKRATEGYEILGALEQRIFDLSVLGAGALHLKFGFLGPARAHTEIAKVLAERSNAVGFVIDHSKFGRTDANIILPLSKVAVVATDRKPSPEQLDVLNGAGIALLTPGAKGLKAPKPSKRDDPAAEPRLG